MFELLSPHGIVAAALIAPPGAEVISALERVDPLAVDDGVRVDLMVAWERQAAWVTARAIPVLAAVSTTPSNPKTTAAPTPAHPRSEPAGGPAVHPRSAKRSPAGTFPS